MSENAQNEDDISPFDELMNIIGNHGPFQKRFNLVFNLFLVILTSMPYLNIILAMHTPDHWCKVPGRENTNYSIDEWKNLTIPREYDAKGIMTYSKCKMFNVTSSSFQESSLNSEINCQYGWEYDTTWYKSTVASQEDWVCEKKLFTTNTFVACRIGEVVGTLFFGHLGDIIGRKPVLLLSVIFIIAGKVMSIVTASSYYLFLFAAFIGSCTTTSVLQPAIVIAMEISREKDRAYISMTQSVGWAIGISLMPMVIWMVGDWITFLLLTTIPSGIYFFLHGYAIESPRWLANRKKIPRAIKELQKIAKANGTTLPTNVNRILEDGYEEEEKVFGVFSLFSHWRLAKNTLILIYIRAYLSMFYYFLTFNIEHLGGNPFTNFLWQSLVELPGSLLGGYVSDRWGRKVSYIFGFATIAAGCLLLGYTIHDPALGWLTIALSACFKFTGALSSYGIRLQSLEIYPTCLRQTGMSILFVAAGLSGTLGPYIAHLGASTDAKYPYVLFAIFALIGSLLGLLVPETLHRQLPDTLSEAQKFGKRTRKFKVALEIENEAKLVV